MSAFSQEEKIINEDINEDFLEVDPKIPGQNFVCLSFVSPNKVLQDKEVFFNTKFLEHMFNGEDKHTTEMKEKMMNQDVKVDYETVNAFYEDWKYSRNEKLEAEFYEKNDFRTTIRGLKIRGTYDTHKEANLRAQVLRRKDPSFNVFVGQVGSWLPWDPDCEQVPEQEYQEQMLNDLVKKYKENLDSRDNIYDQLKEDQIKKSREDVKAKKEKLAAENEQMKESIEVDSIKNKMKIEELREIVDESDKQYYDNMKKANEQNSNSGVKVTDISEESSSNNEMNISDTESGMKQDNIKSDLINNMDSEDPWMKNKESQKCSKEECSKEDKCCKEECSKEECSKEECSSSDKCCKED